MYTNIISEEEATLQLQKHAPDWVEHLKEPTTMAHVISTFMSIKFKLKHNHNFKHGTSYAYNHIKCRCEECRRQNTIRKHNSRMKLRMSKAAGI